MNSPQKNKMLIPNKYTKSCSVSLAIRKMQIKNEIPLLFIIFKKLSIHEVQSCLGYGEKKTHILLV